MTPPPRSILVFCTHGIGDVVMCLPTLCALRAAYPDTEIEILLRSKLQAEILEGHDLRFSVRTLKELKASKLALARQVWCWRRRRFDLCVSTYNVHAKQAWALGRAAGVRRLIGYLRLEKHVPFDLSLRPEGLHKIDENLRLLEALDQPVAPTDPRWHVSEEEAAWAASWLGLDANAPRRSLVGLTPGCTPHEDFKRWPIDRYVDTVTRLAARQAIDVVVFGGPGEENTMQPLTDMTLPTGRVVNAVGNLTLRQSAAVMARCDAVLGGDCGLTHIAAALDLPTLVLVGPTDPRITAPRGRGVEVIQSPHDCLACYEKELRIDPNCPAPACMHMIDVDRVVHQMISVLEASSSDSMPLPQARA